MSRPAGVLLTGGVGRRLGHDKARLVFDGQTLAARAAGVLAEVCDDVVEVGPGAAGITSTREEPPGAGPLAALAAGADALGRPPLLLVLAVDLPRVGAPLLALLAGHAAPGVVVPMAAGERQWTCARYDGDAIRAADHLLRRGVRSLRALAGEVGIADVAESEWGAVAPSDAFLDVDTAADARRLGIDLPTTS